MFNIEETAQQNTQLKSNIKKSDIFIKSETLFGEIEHKLNVWVVGCGAVGSGVIELLSRSAPYVESCTVIDFDVVEAGNLGCQCFGESDVGKPKVYAIKDRVLNDRKFKVNCINDKITSANITRLLPTEPGDVVIVTVDNVDVAKLIFQYMMGREPLIVMYPGIPLHVEQFQLSVGTLRIMFDDADLADILEAYQDTTQDMLLARVADQLERGCRAQQYAPLVTAVCVATVQLFTSLAFAINTEDPSWLLNSLERVYNIGGVLPYIHKTNTYS